MTRRRGRQVRPRNQVERRIDEPSLGIRLGVAKTNYLQDAVDLEYIGYVLGVVDLVELRKPAEVGQMHETRDDVVECCAGGEQRVFRF